MVSSLGFDRLDIVFSIFAENFHLLVQSLPNRLLVFFFKFIAFLVQFLDMGIFLLDVIYLLCLVRQPSPFSSQKFLVDFLNGDLSRWCLNSCFDRCVA